MRPRVNRFAKPSVVCGAIFVVLLAVSASAGADPPVQAPEARLPTDKAVWLQIRISEAKRKPESVRYYKSAARGRKKAGGRLPVVLPRGKE